RLRSEPTMSAAARTAVALADGRGVSA
ncbi:MAG: hypothetical protein QOE93_807, partial [Actinomycetota bacterium]|nr:hypothetical protein [Actinomycetota bacterium]